MTPSAIPTPEMPTTLVGALCIATLALAGVVVYLFKVYASRNTSAEATVAAKDKEIAEERKQWAVLQAQQSADRARFRAEADAELESLRSEHERAKRELADRFAADIGELRDMHLEREDEIRKDCADRIERIALEASKAATAQNAVLDKIYERFVGPKRGQIRGPSNRGG